MAVCQSGSPGRGDGAQQYLWELAGECAGRTDGGGARGLGGTRAEQGGTQQLHSCCLEVLALTTNPKTCPRFSVNTTDR